MADYQQLFQIGQQMQGRLQQLQSELAHRSIEATAGGGMVRVVADGQGTIRSAQIEPAAFDGRDAELLSDLVLSPAAEVQRRAAEVMQAERRKVQGPSFPAPS